MAVIDRYMPFPVFHLFTMIALFLLLGNVPFFHLCYLFECKKLCSFYFATWGVLGSAPFKDIGNREPS